jgi:hypothetical protein
MLKHIVFIRLDSSYNASEKITMLNKLKDMLDVLPESISHIKKMETGINFSTRNSAFDLSLSVELNDEEALNSYRVHPEHKKVLEYMRSLSLETAVVDYIM